MMNNYGYPQGPQNQVTYGNYGYSGGQGSMASMYQQQAQQQSQQVQGPRMYVIPGKPISDLKEITVQDVPNDGSCAYFPFSDGSGIISKAWNNEGSIDTKLYVYQDTSKEKAEESNILNDILKRLERIESKLGGGRAKPSEKGGSGDGGNVK